VGDNRSKALKARHPYARVLQYRQSVPAFSWAQPIASAMDTRPELFVASHQGHVCTGGGPAPSHQCRVNSFPGGHQPSNHSHSGCPLMYYGLWNVSTAENLDWYDQHVLLSALHHSDGVWLDTSSECGGSATMLHPAAASITPPSHGPPNSGAVPPAVSGLLTDAMLYYTLFLRVVGCLHAVPATCCFADRHAEAAWYQLHQRQMSRACVRLAQAGGVTWHFWHFRERPQPWMKRQGYNASQCARDVLAVVRVPCWLP
jgi:hypothetical protein